MLCMLCAALLFLFLRPPAPLDVTLLKLDKPHEDLAAETLETTIPINNTRQSGELSTEIVALSDVNGNSGTNASGTLLYRRVGRQASKTRSATIYPILDDDWQEIQWSRGLIQENVVIDPLHQGFFILRVEGRAPFLVIDELSHDFVHAQSLQSDTRLDVTISPPLTETAAKEYHLFVDPDGSSGIQAQRTRLVCLEPPHHLAPVLMASKNGLRNVNRIDDLHAGKEYTISVEAVNARSPKTRSFAPATVTIPASQIIAWNALVNLTVAMEPSGNKFGTIMSKRANQDGGYISRGVINGTSIAIDTSRWADGDYQFFGAGKDWVSVEPYPIVHVSNGQPRYSNVNLHWEKGGGTHIECIAGPGALERAQVFYHHAGGTLDKFPVAGTIPDIGVYRWSSTTLFLPNLRAHIYVTIFAPSSGSLGIIPVSPGKRHSCKLASFPKVTFQRAKQQAKRWSTQSPPLKGYCSIQRNIAPEGIEPHWVQILFVDTRLVDAFDEQVWDLAIDPDGEYRIRIKPKGMPPMVEIL